MGIRMKSILVMGIIGLIAIVAIGVTSYKLSIDNAMKENQVKTHIILNYAMSTMDYMKKVQKPLVSQLIESDRFYPELQSGFVSARGTFELFQKAYPCYTFRQATLDPLNPYNKADQQEVALIQKFKANKGLKSEEGIMTRNGEEVYYFAQPVSVDNEGCLRCHGDPVDAPKDQVEIYGETDGYNWKMNDTVAAFVIYIPTAAAIKDAQTLSGTLVAIAAIGMLLTLLGIWIFLNTSVVSPIVHLAERTEHFSLGENLDDPIATKSSGEIGVLANAIERLRISLVKLLK
ncbi:MAG: hypothetical protein C0622_05085 [Desulfuromonas sp.]|nr:MAG: hypothetical protein C0622_05085 [Desulfuromonas sp.]